MWSTPSSPRRTTAFTSTRAWTSGARRRRWCTRCAAILRRVEQLFPGAGDASRVEYWSGLRPATPSNLPYIGASRIANLFLNTGHGTLGWTMACGSGRLVADLVTGRRPDISTEGLAIDRYDGGRGAARRPAGRMAGATS